MTEVMIVPLIMLHPTIYLQEPFTIRCGIYRNLYRRLATLINERTFQMEDLKAFHKNSLPKISIKELKKNQSIFMLFKFSSNLYRIEVNELIVTSEEYQVSELEVKGKLVGGKEHISAKSYQTARLKALIISCPKENAKELCEMNISYLTMLTEDEIEDMYKWKDNR